MSETRYAIVCGGRVIDEVGGDTIVPWFSFTKTVIAAAALTLVRDGILQLDGPVEGQRYTLRQLLQHRAGLTDYGSLPDYHEAVAKHDNPWTVEDLLTRTNASRLRYEPGQGWAYSNIGYLLVRNLTARATASPFETVVASRVFQPLGIKTARLVVQTDGLKDVEMGDARDYHPGWVYHGLIVGSLCDAASLLDRLLGGNLLPAQLLAELQKGHPVDTVKTGRPWQAPHYGLGLMMEGSDGPVGHTGGGAGSVIAAYRSRNRAAPLSVAAFAPGDDTGYVEHFAFAKLRA